MNPLRVAMPAMVAHEGEWLGMYRHVGTDGTLIDEHETWTSCAFPDQGDAHYVQHNRLSWADGRAAEHRFGGSFANGRLRWQTDRFHGSAWETDGVVVLRLDRRDVTDAYYVEMITLATDGLTRARTWQWFQGGRPWKRTLCDERRL